MKVTLPFCAPYLLTAAKLALAYAFIGVIGSEFILARSGMGYEISFAYTNFDNQTMYPLIVLILLLAPSHPVGAMTALVVSQFLGDAFGVIPLILAVSLRQSLLSNAVLGRVGATFSAVGGGAAVAGALVGGALGETLGLRGR